MILVAEISSFIATLLMIEAFRRLALKLRIVATDYHKPNRPEVPNLAGIPLTAGLVLSYTLFYILGNKVFLPIALSTILGGFIGLFDDIADLPPAGKVAFGIIPSIPLIASHILLPRPLIPFIGRTRLTLAYYPGVMIYTTVMINAVNMIDSLNGLMPGVVLISMVSMVLSSSITGMPNATNIGIATIPPLLAYYLYNRYPSKVFGGNVASMAIGSTLASLALVGRVEVPGVVSILPIAINGYCILASTGLKGRNALKTRPVIVTEGRLRANPSQDATVTLISMLCREKAKSELTIILEIYALMALSGFLAIITAFLCLG